MRDGFLIATVQLANDAPPGWPHMSGLPDELPFSTLVYALEEDRHQMRARFLDALRAHAATGVAQEQLDERFGEPLRASFRSLFGGRGSTPQMPGFHEWALEAAAGEESPVVRQVMTSALVRSETATAEQLLRDGPVSPRTREVRAAITENQKAEPPESLPLEPSALRARLTQTFPPFVEAIEAHITANPAVRSEVIRVLDEVIRQQIAAEKADYTFRLFEALARLDRSSAVAVSNFILTANTDEQLARMARTLKRFADTEALDAYLDSLGFHSGGTLSRLDAPLLDVLPRLRERGNAIWFDAETGHVPADHSEVLYWLAALIPALSEAEFEMSVPEGPLLAEEDENPRGPGRKDSARTRYLLRAHLDGGWFSTPARALGDFRDVPPLFGLINALLVSRSSTQRVAWLEPLDQGVAAVAGPKAALAQLKEDGLISFGEEIEARH